MKRASTKNYQLTRFACYLGYFSQAFVCNFLPLLYVMFYTRYKVSLSQIALFGVVNFLVQMAVDLSSVKLIDLIGYRVSAVAAHIFIVAGFFLLTILPEVMDEFTGILIAIAVFSVGGGLDEVIISPIIESCPSDKKKGQMGLLHSMFCFGSAGVILISSLCFTFLSVDSWRIVARALTAIPSACAVLFLFCPVDLDENRRLSGETEPKGKVLPLLKNKYFYLFFLMILCAGTAEVAISQWVSTYAELGLGIEKTYGDIFGAMAFALVMGVSRFVYSKIADRFKTENIMLVGGAVALAAYLLASVVPNSVVNLIGCILAGVGVACLWPASYSLANQKIKNGGSPLFSLLAFGGDIGCVTGSYIIGGLANFMSLNQSVFCATAFPVLLIAVLILYKIALKKDGAK